MSKKKTLPDNEDFKNEDSKIEDEHESLEPIISEIDEINDLKNQLLRTLADNENNRRRYEKEKDDLSTYVISNFAKEMLSVLDNLQRAMEVSEKIDIEAVSYTHLRAHET